MLTTIFLFGELGHKFGRKWKLYVESPAEAIRAIEANAAGFVDYLATAEDRGVAFKVKVDGELIGPERLNFKRSGAVIRISPVASGAKNGTAMIIIGAVLVLATYGAAAGWFGGAAAVAGTGGAAGTAASGVAGWASVGFGASLVHGVGALGLSMAIGGISQMLAPQPGIPKLGESGKPSYLFAGPVNTVQQGGPVPLCYGGPILVG